VQYEDGGMARGGKPLWSLSSLGDTGNGFLSAIAILQALRHRERTGEGQMCTTAIVNAQLLNCSNAVAFPDGTSLERPRTDATQLGFSAGYRLYETADGWLCLVLARDEHWARLCGALGREDLARDPRFATAAERARHDAALARILEETFAKRAAREWFAELDGAGVPCEISSPDAGQGLHDDPEVKARGWVASYPHPFVGRLDQVGLVFDLSDTPGRVQGPPLVVGQHSREILAELGYAPDAIDECLREGFVAQWTPAGA
jgi:crotonobetainyl-CoA:carnitine CoA-transferase CaiB-like acyl-CoA transferase